MAAARTKATLLAQAISVVIRDAPIYPVVSTINYQGLDYLVLEDKGDDVWLGVPEHTMPTRGGEPVL